MGLTDKLKNMMGKHSDQDEVPSNIGTGTGHGTGTGSGSAVPKGERAVESHMPGHHGSTGNTGTGTGTGTSTGGQSAVQRGEQAVESRMPGHHGSTGTGTGVGTGTGGQSTMQRGERAVESHMPGHHGSSTGTGTQGYSSGTGSGMTGNTGGYNNTSGSGTRSYQVGDQGDIDNRRGDMSNIVSSTPNVQGASTTQTLSADYDRAHWKEAMEKTELAEHEVAEAQLHASKANNALGKAQQAEGVMGQHASEHDRLLAEAERQRGLVQDPSNLRGGLNSAQHDLDAARGAAAQHNRALKDADAAFAAKQSELDGLAPKLKAQDQKLSGLASEYDNAMAKRDAVAADAERLRGLALEAERSRGGLHSTVQQLMEKLRLAEEEMVTRERAFLAARDNHKNLHDQLRRARGELDGVNAQYEKNAGAANTAIESAQGWDDKTAQLRNRLQEHENEHNRLLDLIRRLKAELEAMLADLEGLRRSGQPNKQAIEQAELGVTKQRRSLAEAEEQARSAEARYRQLVGEADRHKASAADAASSAKNHAGKYQGELKEAELHGDRHVQLWNEAQEAGGIGSSNATSTFQELKHKVEGFTHREP